MTKTKIETEVYAAAEPYSGAPAHGIAIRVRGTSSHLTKIGTAERNTYAAAHKIAAALLDATSMFNDAVCMPEIKFHDSRGGRDGRPSETIMSVRFNFRRKSDAACVEMCLTVARETLAKLSL
jgi:hypothetical protein